MFGTQAMRLLRENWQNATQLAEELYAIFQNTIPLETNAPLTIGPVSGTVPPLTLQTGQNGNTLMNFGRNGPLIGSLQFNDQIGGPWLYDKNGQPLPAPSALSGGSGGGSSSPTATIAVIQSGGPGTIYQAKLYSSGLSGPADSGGALFTVNALGVANDATIPANLPFLAWKVGTDYYFQPPIFLDTF